MPPAQVLWGTWGRWPDIPQTLPAGGGSTTSPASPWHPRELALEPRCSPRGSVAPAPEEGACRASLLAPKGHGINMSGANTSHVKSPRAGYRITTSHVYFKEEAHPPEAPKSQHQGPGGHFGGVMGCHLPHPMCRRPQAMRLCSPTAARRVACPTSVCPQGHPKTSCLLWDGPGYWGCWGSSPISQGPKLGFPKSQLVPCFPAKSQLVPPESLLPAAPRHSPPQQPGLALLRRAELVSLWPFRGG